VDFWIFLDFQFPTVFSLFHCHVIYAIHIWSCSAESNFKEILIKQKQALRIISGAQYNAHTEPLFKMQNILPINDLILFFKLEFMQQYVQGLLPQSFAGVWRTIGEQAQDEENRPNLRSRDYYDLVVPFARLTITERFPLTSFPKIWNAFNDFDIKFLRNKCEFNSKLKALLLSKLNANYRCNRLLCHFCHLSN
jgi:hypothetical protein